MESSRLRTFFRDQFAAIDGPPELRLVVVANLLSGFNSGLLILALPLFLMSRGLSLIQLGGLFSIVALGGVAVQVLAGRSAILRRAEVVVGLLAVAALAFPMYLFVTTPLQFVAIAAVAGMASSAASPGLQALIAEIVPPRERAAAFARLGSLWSYTYGTALVVGGLLLSLGFAAVFVAGTLSSLLAVCVTIWPALVQRSKRPSWDASRTSPEVMALVAEIDRAERDARDTRRAIGNAAQNLTARLPTPRRAVRNVPWIVLHIFLFDFALAIYPVFFPIHLRSHGLPLSWIGLAVAASWITFGIAQPWGAKWSQRTGKWRPLVVASLLVAAALNVALAVAPLAGIVVAWILLGFADGVGRPVVSDTIARSVTYGARGRAFGWTGGSSALARFVAPFSFALMIAGTSLTTGFLLVSGLLVVAAVPLLFVSPIEAPSVATTPASAPVGAA